MMDKHNNITKQYINADEKKPVSPAKDPTPIRDPVPDPNTEHSSLNPGCDDDNKTPLGVYLNGSYGSSEDSGIKSPAGGSRPKKSVRWSHELVMESPAQRDFARGSSNPYVNYSPAPSANSSSFNFKGWRTVSPF